MKKMMKTWVLVAAAAMGLTACQNDIDEQIEAKDSVTVEFIADSADSRTSVDTSGDTPVFTWAEAGETFAVLEQTTSLAKATSVTYKNEEGLAKITATFDNNSGQTEYKYATIYPESGYYGAESINKVTLSLLPEQTMYSPDSYDFNCDLMVSEVVTTDAQPTDAQSVRFTRLAAVAKMSFKGLGLELGDQVQSVTFTAEGKTLAGTITADLENLIVEGKHAFTVAEGASSVTVNTTSASDVYFTLLPTTLDAGDKYTVTIITDKYLYVKQGEIPTDKSLAFEAGMVTRFGVDMSGVAPSDKWVLVKDASTLKQGDVVTIVAKNYNYVIGKQGSNYPIASQTEIVKFGDYLYHPIATNETTVDNRIQHFTLLKRDDKRVAFDFYNGVDYDGDTSVGFLWANGSNYAPKLQAFCDVNTLFDVTISEGVATIKASDIEKNYKWLRYYHSTTASSRRFDMTSSEPTGNNQICIYRLEGAVGTIPTVAANVTVPDADESVVVAEEGTATPTAIEEVVFNYVGDWNIAVEDNADWLAVSYADGKLSYTAEGNTSAKREATVTITASLEGEEDLTWTFNVLQKGAPEEISIADFITKPVDVNVEYKITGRVKVVPSSNSSSATYEIEDANGNVAKATYLYTEDGSLVKTDDAIGLAVGDVVTITGAVAGVKGKIGSSSSYKSTYKGHYRLTATVEPAIVGYEGGDATISVALEQNGTLGTLCAPTAIEGTMTAEGDFATFSYTTNAPTATVTVAANSGAPREVIATFNSGLAEASVKVAQGSDPTKKVGWVLVTDESELGVGDKIIIAAQNQDYAISTTNQNTSIKGVAINRVASSLIGVDETSVRVFTLMNGFVDGEFAIAYPKDETTNNYLYTDSASSDRLKVTTSLTYNASWTIEIDSDGGALIDTTYGTSTKTTRRIMCNYTESNQTFCTYKTTTTSKEPVCIYKYYE